MDKIDLTKTYKTYYTARRKPEIVQIEKVQLLAIEGKGDPNAPAFAEKVGALYKAAYTIKFKYKALGKDFIVPKLEALWWFDGEKLPMEEAPLKIPRSEWHYKLLLRMPDFVKQVDPPIQLIEMHEGRCAQVLHVGPFEKEPETLKLLAAFMSEQNLQHNGLHHEIYLSDFRKTAPEKLRTILREPVK